MIGDHRTQSKYSRHQTGYTQQEAQETPGVELVGMHEDFNEVRKQIQDRMRKLELKKLAKVPKEQMEDHRLMSYTIKQKFDETEPDVYYDLHQRENANLYRGMLEQQRKYKKKLSMKQVKYYVNSNEKFKNFRAAQDELTKELDSMAGDLLADTAVEKLMAESAYMSRELHRQTEEVKQKLKEREMEEAVKASEERLQKAFKSTKYALKPKSNGKRTHEDDFGNEYELRINEIAALPNIEEVRRFQAKPSKIAKVLRNTYPDQLVDYQNLQIDDEVSSQSSDGTHYPSLSQQIALDLNPMTRQIAGLDLRDGNKIAKKSDLVQQLQPSLLRSVNEISQILGHVSWNQLLRNHAIGQRRLDTVLRDLRGEASESSSGDEGADETDEELQFSQNNLQGSKPTLSTSESQRRQGMIVDTQDSDGHQSETSEGRQQDPRGTLLSFGEGAGHSHKRRREAVKIKKSGGQGKEAGEKFDQQSPRSTVSSSKIDSHSTGKRKHPTLQNAPNIKIQNSQEEKPRSHYYSLSKTN